MMSKQDIKNLGALNFSFNDLEEIANILNNFREIRRLARLYVLELEQYKSAYKGKMEISTVDLLWLTVLMLTDYPVYRCLFFNKEFFFTNKDFNSTTLLTLSRDIKDDKQLNLPNEHNLSDSSRIILVRLFSTRLASQNSIRYFGNYYNYFYLGLGKGYLSNSDFQDILSDESKIEEKIRNRYSRKSMDSYRMRFSQYVLKGLSLDDCKVFFKALITVMNIYNPVNFSSIITEKFSKHLLKREEETALHDYVIGLLNQSINNLQIDRDIYNYMSFLSSCYIFYPEGFYGDSDWEYPCLLSRVSKI